MIFIEKNAGKTFKNCLIKSEAEEIQILANKIFDSVGEKFASVGAEKISSVVNPL